MKLLKFFEKISDGIGVSMLEVHNLHIRLRDLTLLLDLLDDIHHSLHVTFRTADDDCSELGNELYLCIADHSGSALVAGYAEVSIESFLVGEWQSRLNLHTLLESRLPENLWRCRINCWL